jgi:hypothetical protein
MLRRPHGLRFGLTTCRGKLEVPSGLVINVGSAVN